MYKEVLASLVQSGRAFGCICTRKMLAGKSVYPGTCRKGLPEGTTARSFRFRMEDHSWEWKDVIQGNQHFEGAQSGDFVMRRADGFWAYQLAVVVDDVDQGVNAIIRGSDLLDSTPGQMALREVLAPDFPVSRWGHLPLLVNREGQKLSKQTQASPVDPNHAPSLLIKVLGLLGQPIQESGAGTADSVDHILKWAADRWNPAAVVSKNRQWQGEGHDSIS